MSSDFEVVLTGIAHVLSILSKGVSFVRDVANEIDAANDEVAQIRGLNAANRELPFSNEE